MKSTKRSACLVAVGALALAVLIPATASAHTSVYFGINLGGLYPPPPVEVYAPPVYYAPPPPRVYYVRPAYYAPRVVYGPEVIYYHRRDWDRRWHREWRHDWHHHGDYGWHRGDDDDH